MASATPPFTTGTASMVGMNASELKRLKEVEGELSPYKRMYAELARENHALKDLIEKKF
jgi:putative transposase